MIGFLEILAGLFLAGILLVLLLLIMPVRILLHGNGDTGDGFDLKGRILPFAGLCGIGFHYNGTEQRLELYLGSWRLADIGVAPASKRFGWVARLLPKRGKAPKLEAPKKKSAAERIGGLLEKSRNTRPVIIKAAREILRLVRFDRFHADIRFGLGDPALTGMLAGVIYAVNGVLPSSCTIVPSWDFTRMAAGGGIDMDISILNYRFWGALVRLTPDMLRMRRALAGATS